PASQRQLMTLILRKLLASSTYAISDTLEGLANKLDSASRAAEAVQTGPEKLDDNFEELSELQDEWEDESDDGSASAETPINNQLSPEQLRELREELSTLREFHALAKSIVRNSKGEVLLTALRRGFVAAEKAQKSQGAPALQQKAIIFTES